MRSPAKYFVPLFVELMGVLLSLLLISGVAAAEDTLESVLKTAADQKNVAISYREVRHLQLFNEPWQAAGQMFVTSDVFVIKQDSPHRQLLSANKHRYWLFMPDKDVRRTGMLTSSTARKVFGLFKPIMRGDKSELEKRFDIQFTATEGQWQLVLQPKHAAAGFYKRIIVKGEHEKAASYMKAEMTDGDDTEWFFRQLDFTSKIEEKITMLMNEARGE